MIGVKTKTKFFFPTFPKKGGSSNNWSVEEIQVSTAKKHPKQQTKQSKTSNKY